MKIKATKKQLIAALAENNISRQIDKMALHGEIQIISMDAAKEATTRSTYPVPRATICVKTYVSNKPSTYGYQFLSAVWITIDGKMYQATGSKTGGCGYDKVSTAIGSAFRAVGLSSDLVPPIDGTGQQQEFILALAKKLLGQKRFFMVV